MVCEWCARTHDGGPENCIRGVVLVCGGRDFSSWARVLDVLDKVAARCDVTAIRHGKARGADALAGRWARLRGIPEQPDPADWNRYRDQHPNPAGPIRNERMATTVPVPVLCVAFPGRGGTADMVCRAEAHGIRTWVLR